VTAIPLNPAAVGPALLVIDTRARHAFADGRYAAGPRRRCSTAVAGRSDRASRHERPGRTYRAQPAVSRRCLPVPAGQLVVVLVMLSAAKARENWQVSDRFSLSGEGIGYDAHSLPPV
jgi:hypothetical protein